MELSKRTLGIFKLFSQINENLVIKAGKTQRTIAVNEGVFAEAEIDEDIPVEFPICNLATFLRNFEAAEKMGFTVKDTAVILSDGEDLTLRYALGAPKLIKSPPDKNIKLDRAICSFPITKEQLARVSTLAEINSLPSIIVGSDGEHFYITAKDHQNPEAATARINIAKATDAASVWEERISFERFSKIHRGMDYTIKIIPQNFVAFVGDRLSFVIAVER